MAVKPKGTDSSSADEVDDLSSPMKSRVKIESKVSRNGKPRMVIMEETDDEDEVEHSGIVDDNGNDVFDKNPIRGGIVYNPVTKQYLNAKGKEVDPETGEQTEPDDPADKFLL